MAHAALYISTADLATLQSLVDGQLVGVDRDTVDRLAGEIDRATIVVPERLPRDVVTIESRVSFVDEASGAVREVTVTTPTSADASRGRISVLAPVGAALLGMRAGSAIAWPLPSGRVARFRIRSVAQPGADAASGNAASPATAAAS